jgi:putative hydrolase of HD superfamily
MTPTPGVHFSHHHLAQCYASLVSRLATCSTVGQVWAITEALDAIDAALERTDGDDMTRTVRTQVGTVTDLADAVVDLGRLALAFGRIDRTAVYHPDKITPESDTDHTVMLGWLACALAARFFPQLDQGLVAQFALVHDAPEVYAGDTSTLRITDAGRAAKADRERMAVDRIRAEFWLTLPWFPRLLQRYEAQVEPEARFVRGLDKVLPKIVHLLDDAHGLVEQGMGRAELTGVFERQEIDMQRYVGEFSELMALRAELVDRVLAQPALDSELAGNIDGGVRL